MVCPLTYISGVCDSVATRKSLACLVCLDGRSSCVGEQKFLQSSCGAKSIIVLISLYVFSPFDSFSMANVRIFHIHAYCYHPLAELIQCILDPADGLVVSEFHILQDGKCTNLANDSGKQTVCNLCIASDDQELVCKL